MFKSTSRQRGLFEPVSQLDERSRRRLKSSWAEVFQQRVYPILLESEADFAELYDSSTGRPTWSVARMLGLVLLREMHGLPSDQATVDALAFDARWQHALAVRDAREAYLSKRSLVNFRTRLHREDPELQRLGRLFERITEAALAELGLSVRTQRVDSTFIRSNIARRGRDALLNEALRRLVDAAQERGLDRSLPDEVRAWFALEQGWDRTTPNAIEWLHASLEALESTALADDESFLQARDVLEQQTVVVDDDELPSDDEPPPGGREPRPDGAETPPTSDTNEQERDTRGSDTVALSKGSASTEQLGPSRRKKRTKSAPNSIHSLHDEDAHRGRKGVGYQVLLTETCGNEGHEIITSAVVMAGNASDQAMAIPVLEALRERDLQPSVLLADAGFTSGENLIMAKELGTELRGPVIRARSDEHLNRNDFLTADDGRVLACPEGHAPTKFVERASSLRQQRSLHVLFDRTTCDACPTNDRCPVVRKPSKPGAAAVLDMDPRSIAHDRRQRQQREPAWRRSYAARAGIEATNSELKRAHGLGQLTVRRRVKVSQRVLLKVSGCNIKRMCRALASARADGDTAGTEPRGPRRAHPGQRMPILRLVASLSSERPTLRGQRPVNGHGPSWLPPWATSRAA